MTMPRWSILVVEDDHLTRSLIVNLLRTQGIHVPVDVATVAEALQASTHHDFDAALLDLDLGPGPNGLDLARRLREIDPMIGLVLLTSYRDPRLKDPEADLPRGMVFVDKRDGADAASVISALHTAIGSPHSLSVAPTQVELTTTQIEVLTGVASGLTTAQIAVRRQVSAKAVEQVIARLCEIVEISRVPGMNQRVQLANKFHEFTGRLP